MERLKEEEQNGLENDQYFNTYYWEWQVCACMCVCVFACIGVLMVYSHSVIRLIPYWPLASFQLRF